MGAVVLSNVEKFYDETMACVDINLSINEGEFFTFLGPSGCGKTTILRLIAGFIKPQKGTIHLGTKDITHLAAEKRKVGMVFQHYV
jgi:ABC-type Fe3+/spermidine/putrescine transport system ATPase subunit